MVKLLDNLFSDKQDISGLISAIRQIRTETNIINCVYAPTGYDWLGVNIAGKSIFPGHTIELPQYYSLQVLSDDQIDVICQLITDLHFRIFVFHGFPLYMSKVLKGLKTRDKNIRVLMVYHGFLSELSGDVNHLKSVHGFIQLYQEGIIDRIGVVKAGHEKVFSALFGIESYLLYNKVPVPDVNTQVEKEHDFIHIGVLINHTFRKNLHNQVAAALMTPKSIVHVFDKKDLYYLHADDRIVEHDMMPHHKFVRFLSAMDINLHVTFSESFGGQVFTESLGAGVPCLTGYSNGFLDYDEELKSLLSVAAADDPLAIFHKIEEVLPQRRALQDRLSSYCRKMNDIADKSLLQFINI